MTSEQIMAVIELIIQGITAIAAIWALIYAGHQVKLAAKQLHDVADATRSSAESARMANLMAVIQLEENLQAARHRMVEACEQMVQLSRDQAAGKTLSADEFTYAKNKGDQAVEQYLNVGERLCACLVRGLVSESVYRRDVKNWVDEAVNRFPQFFTAGTRYPNILRCHTQWKEEKSALDPDVMALAKKVA